MIARGAVSAARTTSSETPRLRDLVASLAPFFSWRASAVESLDWVNQTRARSPYAGKTERGQGFPARGQHRPGARLYCMSVFARSQMGNQANDGRHTGTVLISHCDCCWVLRWKIRLDVLERSWNYDSGFTASVLALIFRFGRRGMTYVDWDGAGKRKKVGDSACE